jgi:hypothetical protein
MFLANNSKGIFANFSNYLDKRKTALCYIFGIFSTINIIFPAILAPIIFSDSKKYLSIAQYYISNGFNSNMCLIEIVPGYPLLLSGLVACFGPTLGLGPVLGILQGFLVVISYLFAAGFVYEITGSVGLALITACLSSLSLNMAYNAAAVLTEPCFIFFISGGIYLLACSLRRDSIRWLYGSMCFFLCAAWFRSTIHPLLFLPAIFFICNHIKLRLKAHGRLMFRDVLNNAIVAFTIIAISYFTLFPLKTSDIGFSEKLSATWARGIQFSPSGQKLFKQLYQDDYIDMKAWAKSGAKKPDLSKSRESLLPFAYKSQAEWTEFYKANLQKRIFWWRSPWYYRMAIYGDTEQEAYRWAGHIGIDILANNIVNALKETVIIDIKNVLAEPLRAVKKSLSNYSDKHVIYSVSFAQFSRNLATVIYELHSLNIIFIISFSILTGIIIGIFYIRSLSYMAFALLLIGIFFVNVFVAGKLPRYFAHIIPYSGLSFIFIFLLIHQLYSILRNSFCRVLWSG